MAACEMERNPAEWRGWAAKLALGRFGGSFSPPWADFGATKRPPELRNRPSPFDYAVSPLGSRKLQQYSPPTGSPDRILRIATVLDRTGLSRATLYRKVRDGTFPRQIGISTLCSGWRESEVNEWLESRFRSSAEARR